MRNYWTNYQSHVAKSGLPMQIGQRIDTNYGLGIITNLFQSSYKLSTWMVTIFVPTKNLAYTIGLSQITFGGGINGEMTSFATFNDNL